MELNPVKKRGGPRPGAGAPRGNFNAAKHGRYSKRVHASLYWTDDRRREVLFEIRRIITKRQSKRNQSAPT